MVFSLFLPPPPKPEQEPDWAAIERVKQKLRLAAGPFAQRKASGEDVGEIAQLFAQARQALYGGEVKKAEELVDKALSMLGLLELPEGEAAGTPGCSAGTTGEPQSSASPVQGSSQGQPESSNKSVVGERGDDK